MTTPAETERTPKDRDAAVRASGFGVGLVMLAAGGWLAWPPLALLIPGAILVTAAAYGTTRKEP